MKRHKDFSRKILNFAGCLMLNIFVLASVLTIKAQDKSDESGGNVSPQTVFTNSTAITIPTSGNGSVYPSTITVSGMTGTIANTPGSLKVTINNFSHTNPDDVGIVLLAPGGAAFLLQDGAGGTSDISGLTYTLSDDGATQLPDATVWTAGTFKPAAYFTGSSFPSPGPFTSYSHPGPAGSNSATFTSVFSGLIPNGDWKLFVRDFATGNGGIIADGWSLEITTTPFTSAAQHVVDFNGDGKTDFVVVRNTGGGPSGQITWFVQNNGGAFQAFQWGLVSDSIVPEDYDGDQKTDYAVWRAGAPTVAAFYILQSQTNTFRIESFGQTGDDPSVVGDYDGDGKADLAVYRSGQNSGDQSYWYFRGSLNNPAGNVTYVPWGKNGDFPSPGDYDGDGKNDFVVQSNDDIQFIWARFWLYQTTAGIKSLRFGNPTDRIMPGDYDGDGKTDLCIVKTSGGQYRFWIQDSSTGALRTFIYGIAATDFLAPGDYDGDGKTDVAIWRPGTPGAFWVQGSASGSSVVLFGLTADYPVANFNVH